jgi:hypothetical protein
MTRAVQNQRDMKPKEIESYLKRNGMHPDSITGIDSEGRLVEIEINNGDWKHEHGRCRHLMAQAGYVRQDIEVTQEDGSDCFSAVHTYAKI